jgi:glycosyltransferase involved in cell wall biosynthesis
MGTYNREGYVREALDSVFAQTYPNLEIIVVDNASTDRTVEVVRSYGERVRVITRDVNSGTCSVTRNEASRAAAGDYVAFLDSDDAWYPEKIARQVQFMQDHPDIPLSHTYCHLMDEASRVYGIRHENAIPPTGRVMPQLLGRCFITISSVMITRELYRTMGPFREELPFGQLGEDYDFFLRVAAGHPIGFLPEPLVKYRKSQSSITHGNWRATPKPIPFLWEVLQAPDGYYDGVSRGDREAAYLAACAENARHWRMHGFPARSAWAAAQGIRANLFDLASWAELFRGVVGGSVRAVRRPPGSKQPVVKVQ